MKLKLLLMMSLVGLLSMSFLFSASPKRPLDLAVTNSTYVPIILRSDCSGSKEVLKVPVLHTLYYKSTAYSLKQQFYTLSDSWYALLNQCSSLPIKARQACHSQIRNSPDYIALNNNLKNTEQELNRRSLNSHQCTVYITTEDGTKSTKLTINSFNLAVIAKENYGLSIMQRDSQHIEVVLDR